MIVLTRLRLINWHNFSDVTISFETITYFIGVNAVGKTTILDAIRYCLTTNRNFNTAGNQRSKRTLQGSVHAKQREENLLYLRPGHTVSYIGTEFYNTDKKTNFVVIARVESESPSVELHHISQDWYISKLGVCLEDLNFIDTKSNIPTSRAQFETVGKKLERAKTQKDARNRICMALGVGKEDSPLGKKFNEVFHMGTSLSEIADIRTFIYAYILPEPEINLETLLSDMRELEHLQDVLGQAMKRAALLEEIISLLKAAQERDDAVVINDGLILLAEYHGMVEEESSCLQTLERAARELDDLDLKLVEIKEKRQVKSEALAEARRKESEHEENKALQYFREQEAQAKKEFDVELKKQIKLNSAEEDMKDLCKLLSQVSLGIPQSLMPDALRKQPQNEQAKGLFDLARTFRDLEPQIQDVLVRTYRECEDCREERERLEDEIRTLRSGKWLYPEGGRAEIVRNAINKELSAKGYDSDARILCDLLVMKDESWQDAIEASLGARRFDILVSPNHYATAKQVYISLQEAVGNVSLIDTPSLLRDSQHWKAPRPFELAYQVASENILASAYTSNLLHGYRCCDVSDMLEQYPRSITRDRLRHQGYRLERLRKPERYIGQQARKERLIVLEAQHVKLLEQQKLYAEQYNKRKGMQRKYLNYINGSALADLRDGWDSPAKCRKLERELEEARKQITAIEQSPLLQGIFNRIARCERDFKAVDDEHDALQQERGKWEEVVKTAQNHKAELADTVEKARQQYSIFCETYPLFEKETRSKFLDLSKTRAAKEIVKNQTNYRNQLINARNTFLNGEVIPKQNEYNGTYSCDYPRGLEGAEIFRSLFNTLYNVDLEKYAEDLRQAQIRCKERFRKDILFRMKDDIAQAKRQVRDLENIMKDLNYGEETYHFVLGSSKNPEFSSFYSIIMDESNRQINEVTELEASNALQDRAYEAQVEELMRKIMADVESASDARLAGGKSSDVSLSKYVDYRTYLDYDIKIDNAVTKGSALLSQVSGDSSGGENQAPYYVAICASLLQIYKNSDNSIRLILLDEAFNRMTSDRIFPMMRLFQESHMQVVLVSTTEKCTAIQPACDITYSIIKSGSRNAIRPFIKEFV
ncbi:MAG: SbcC/MukB-like Walker B domain-containing protein [Candidatus Pelethousia sp.]|nr:SbcC/MukB-like Walker B domain-containing protein [Candidatus Pelethousia sp.]